MLCPKCGTELPEEARFCWKCGAPQPKPAEPATVPEYEYCDIKFVDRFFGFFYEARCNRAVIARSRDSIHTRREANQDVVNRLAVDGWEPIEKDKAGLVTRMRRLKAA